MDIERSATRTGLMVGLLLALAVVLLGTSGAVAQPEPDPGPQATTPSEVGVPALDAPEEVVEPAASAAQAAPAPAPEPEPKDPLSYHWWVLLPAGLAILLAIFVRQVVPALFIGVLVGAYMMFPCLSVEHRLADGNPAVNGFRLAVEDYVVGALVEAKDDHGHMKIIVFTLVIGGLVGVIGRNGGTAGLVKLVAGETRSPRRGALTAWLAGLVVFFDDYANTMIVGPTMRSVFDRLRLSRAKLAYIVDSTAAPVASLALIGTWIGAEIGYIQGGIDSVTASGVPAFLEVAPGQALDGMQAFLGSLPYRFYPILALVLVFLICLTGRDFGPMKSSEARALGANSPAEAAESQVRSADQVEPRWALGLLPILVLLFVTLGVLYVTGRYNPATQAALSAAGQEGAGGAGQALTWAKQASLLLANSNAYLAILYGAVIAACFAVLQTMLAQVCTVREVVDAGVEGMSRMFPAIVILTLAWALSKVSTDLKLGETVAGWLEHAGFSVYWLPVAVFGSAALISFATGTSWGTMGILCPVTVEIAARLIPGTEGLDDAHARHLFYAAVGSVLAGAIFGDHCSPISDTTVLSSVATGCRHEEHVWTQIPYALVTAVVAMGLGDVLCSVYDQPWYYGLAGGTVLLVLVVLLIGRRPAPFPPFPPPQAQRAALDALRRS